MRSACQDSPHRPGTFRRPAAFTLVELLVVVSIILLMVAILAPAAVTAFRLTEKYISRSYIHLIQGGIGQYRNDFGDYPPSTGYSGMTGAKMLAMFLTGYAGDADADGKPTDLAKDDGQEGFGFRVAQRGVPHGPYNGCDELPMLADNVGDPNSARVFVDRFNRPILYYRFDKDNSKYEGAHNTGGPADVNEYAKSGGKYVRTDFLLISPGGDGLWAIGGDGKWGTDDDETLDDPTNLEAD